jgi:hypothetical protein
MGQGSNSRRNASLDEKKRRAAGRQQNEPTNEAITGRQEVPPVAGAFGREPGANSRGDGGDTTVTDETPDSGDATENLGAVRDPARND